MLKQANTYYYGGAERCVNDLWRIILSPFQDEINSRVGDRSFDEALYVSTRLRESASEEDIFNYIRAPDRKLFLLHGRAGLGKTTFLQHTLNHQIWNKELNAIWADMLSLLGELESDEALTILQRYLGAELDRLIFERGTSDREWDTFFLANCTDETGVAKHIRAELSKAELGSEWLLKLSDLKARTDMLEHIRLRIRFLKKQLGQEPVIVIDNVDQLPARTLQRIARFALELADGLRNPLRPMHEETGAAAVILALRPISLGLMQKGTSLCLSEVVEPPDIQEVLRKRLERFFAAWDKRVIRNRTLIDARGRRFDLSSLSPEMHAVVTSTSGVSAKALIAHMVSFMTSQEGPYGALGPLIHQLLNYNTRLTLLVITHYVASGHIDLPGLLRAMQRGDSPRSVLSWRKALGALMLGVRSMYDSRQSWLWNMWNDGCGDRVGSMIQPRLLRLVLGQLDGLHEQQIIHTLATLFDYPSERVSDTLTALQNRGLLDEYADKLYRVSDAGVAYMRSMSREFEYLQHVAVDVYVEDAYLVKCTMRDEPAHVRFERVLKLSQWLRELEVSELANALNAGALKTYIKFYQDDTISEVLATTMMSALEFLPRSNPKLWGELDAEARSFARSASYPRILADARQFAGVSAPAI